MSEKNELLQNILDSLGDSEQELIEETATDAGGLTNTENKEAKKSIPKESPKVSEGKLGLSVLSKSKHEEDILNFNGVEANKPDGQGTENISPKSMPTEPGTVFEKKASDETISRFFISRINWRGWVCASVR